MTEDERKQERAARFLEFARSLPPLPTTVMATIGNTPEADLPPELLATAREIERQLKTNPTDDDLLALAEDLIADAAYHKANQEREARWEEDMKVLQMAVEWEIYEEEERAKQHRERELDNQEDE